MENIEDETKGSSPKQSWCQELGQWRGQPTTIVLGWWRGVAVKRFIRSTKLLYVEPG